MKSVFNLQNEIINLNKELYQQLPEDILKGFENSIYDYKNKEVEKNAVKVFDHMPDFSLLNANGNIITLNELLENGKLVITFFRGSWCPYCNIQFKALSKIYDQISALGANLVAISPQTNLHYKSISDSNNLQFELLYDPNNMYAEKLGLVLKLQDFVIPIYEKLGVNIDEYNGNKNYTVPIPAVFVVNSQKIIEFAFIDANYTNRINLDLLLEKLL